MPSKRIALKVSAIYRCNGNHDKKVVRTTDNGSPDRIIYIPTKQINSYFSCARNSLALFRKRGTCREPTFRDGYNRNNDTATLLPPHP